jgi:hypothetical protein
MAQGKKFIPTDAERSQVEAMAGYGVPHEQIACIIRDGIDADTLKKHFRKELTQGKAKASAKIGQTLFQKATGGDTTAAIFWAKTQMGWKEKQEIEHTGPNGGAIQTMSTITTDPIEAAKIYQRLMSGKNN